MSAAPYWELALAAPEEIAEALANFFWEHRALGVVEAQADVGRTWIRAFFPPDTATADLERDVHAYLDGLSAMGFAAEGRPRLVPLADENWAEAWREHFRPIPVGQRLVIVPPWRRSARRGRLAIVIEPGRAFGTGHHGSTASCLERLETLPLASIPRAIDIGTGSGILAIAAVKLGVGRVLAVDEDPDAVAAAEANAKRNGVGDRIRCEQADAARLRTEPAPLVLANLLAVAHRRLARRYGRYVTAGGALLLGGILDHEAAEVSAALERHGFAHAGAVSNDGWTCLELRRTRARPKKRVTARSTRRPARRTPRRRTPAARRR
jgi:ribosomal protein L11 methyltransferase